MHERLGIARDRHVARPEQEIAAPQIAECRVRFDRSAERLLLQVGIARRGNAAGVERDLQQPGAIDPQAGLAAPQLGHAAKALGDRDEIGFEAPERH